jgi:hypothetical protein
MFWAETHTQTVLGRQIDWRGVVVVAVVFALPVAASKLAMFPGAAPAITTAAS